MTTVTQRILDALDDSVGKSAKEVAAACGSVKLKTVTATMRRLVNQNRIRLVSTVYNRGGWANLYCRGGAAYPLHNPIETQPASSLPIPASIFHLGSIITVNQRGWKAVNESFRRRA